MTSSVIEVRDLTKTYRRARAVDALDFEVRPGTVTAFLGPNGSGKTTTMRILLGLSHATQGEALVFGDRYRNLSHPVRRIGALIDGLGFHPGRSAQSHLYAIASAAGIGRERVSQVLEVCDLERAATQRVSEFSTGMRQRLGLASALIGEPELLILDEPANGLDPAGVRWLRSYLREFAESGRTVFISSHALGEVANVADEAIVINRGRLVTQERTTELLSRGEALVIRLGETDGAKAALTSRGATVDSLGDKRLRVNGLTADEILAVTRELGLPVEEIQRTTHSLEEVFLGLVERAEEGADV